MIRAAVLLAAPALLLACAEDRPEPAPDTTPSAAAPTATEPALAIEGEGLRLFDPATGSARPRPASAA